MTRIRATCPSCGEVDLQPADIELTIVGIDPEDVGDGSCYRFACPACTDTIEKPADARIARLLASGGVAVRCTGDQLFDDEVAAAMALLDHPEGMPVTPPLTTDDLIDFHLLLQRDDWFAELAQQVR